MKSKFFVIIISIYFGSSGNSQSWTKTEMDFVDNKGKRDLSPTKFILYNLTDTKMRDLLWSAPRESRTDVQNSNTIIEIALPDESLEKFKVVQYDMMEPELAAKYPDIRTYYGISTINSLTRIRIDYTYHGFRAVITSPGQDKVFIDHFQRNDKNTRIVYYKKDYKNGQNWECSVTDEHITNDRIKTNSGSRIGDCQLRSYRLAQAANGEYSNYHGATSSAQSGLVMTAVVNVINRINEVYEAEVAVRLLLVGNTDLIFYYNPSTDPYTNGNGSTMLTQNQNTCNSVIGSTNYDIGHVFSTGGGGVAYLGSVCGSNKAGGVTGQSQPIGDPFSIDYVAHEMGHQFGGNHTQYNNCNRSTNSAMEPGSASTIMGYAGICTPNVQNNSDAYFHARSLQEIKTFINTGSSCETFISSFVNNAPTVSSQPNYSIPVSTPFALTLSATDPEGNPITYAWEQMNAYSNPAQPMPPASTNTTGPTFRSIVANTSPTRYFPPLANIIANTTNTWQVLPSIARSMSFRGVARDFTGVAGCNNEINITVSTVNATAGAFSITSFNSASTWLEGDIKTITWNVANTSASPVNAANVDILLSYDGGNTYPITLAAATPNDGTQNITVPAGLTTQGRIMVKGTNHIFFDINNANITINPGLSSFELTASPNNFSVCNGTNISSTITVQQIGSFTSPVTLSVSGLPSGATSSFSINPINPGSSSILMIDGLNISGNYTVSVNGVGGSLNRTTPIQLNIQGNGNLVSLTSPANMATNVSLTPLLSWSTATGSLTYDVQLAYDNNFSNIINNSNTTATSFQVVNMLYGGTTYYWRVRSINNCGPGSWSAATSFTTENCWFYSPNIVPITITSGNTNPVFSNMAIPDRGTVTDVNIVDMSGNYLGGLSNMKFSLYSPQNVFSLFWDSPCNKDVLFDIQFDDNAANMNWPCPPNNGQYYMPSNALSILNGQELKGNWSLKLDRTDPNGGTLNTWGTKVCANNICQLTVQHDRVSGPGSLIAAINCALDGDTIRIAQSINNDTFNLGNQNMLINKRIFLECDLSRNIHIISSSTLPTIVNSTSTLGDGLKLKGLHIHSSNSGIGAIDNQGKLTLEDVILYKWNGTSTSTISNQSSALIDFIGNCKVTSE